MKPQSPTELAFISTSARPYRTHLLLRLVDEIPDVSLHSLFLRDWTGSPWTDPPPMSVNPVHFGGAPDESDRGRIANVLDELRRGRAVVRYLDENRIGAVILNGYAKWTFLRVIATCRRAGIPLFLRGDSNIRGDNPRGRLRYLGKSAIVGWAIRRSRGVMVMGEYGQAYFEKYGATPGNIFWVPVEPDYSHFASVDPGNARAFCRDHDLAPDRKRILFSGRFVDRKRVDMAIDGFTRIADARPDWDLLVAGAGPLESDLRERVPVKVNRRIHWLGLCGPAEISLAYSVSSVLLVPSEVEPWGLIVNEAMAAGVSVIASNVVGAARELVRDGENGRIFESGNLDALVECLLDVTDTGQLERYRAGVSGALAEWRTKADPIEGIRRALHSAALIG